MNFDKISVTLYDLLGYLLPGFVLLITCSIAEASFSGSNLFALSRINEHPIISAVTAYFLGHVSHGVGSMLTDKLHRRFKYAGFKMDAPVKRRVTQVINETYKLEFTETEKLSDTERYLLADSFVLASGGSTERDILTAREGFYKASMIAFTLLGAVLFATVFLTTKIQMRPAEFTTVNRLGTIILSAFFVLLALLFRQRYMFFKCIKNSTTLRLFLGLRHKQTAPETKT